VSKLETQAATKLLSEPGDLREYYDQLLAHRRTHPFDVEYTEALAECSFRLAVHPETPPEKAFELLQRAIKIDGANPKYAYHLARLYFIHGEFQQAAVWLRVAARLCPTSHRIWTHVSLLQRELNACYYGDESFEPDVLRKRSDEIAAAVRAGQDNVAQKLLDFVPPKSLAAIEREKRQAKDRGGSVEDQSRAKNEPEKSDDQPGNGNRPTAKQVRRLLNPNRCRWSGINDLLIEQTLEAAPSKRTLKTLIGYLEEVAAMAPERRNGFSAFAILGIQWILCGYPVATIQRLRAGLRTEVTTSSLELLDLVCTLYEIPSSELPQQLATALEMGELPPLLTGLIHQRRLLWKPLEFRSLATYRAARKFLALAKQTTPDTEEARKAQRASANEYVRKLIRATEALNPQPPAQLEDLITEQTVTDTRDEETVTQRFEQLCQIALAFETHRQNAFHYLKTQLEPLAREATDGAAYSQATTDAEAFGRLLNAFKQASEIGTRRLDSLLKIVNTLNSEQLPEEFNRRKEECDKQFKALANLGNFEKVLKRIDGQLAETRSRFDVNGGTCSPVLAETLNAVTTAFPVDGVPTQKDHPVSSTNDAPAEPRKTEVPAGLDHLQALAWALARTEREITELFKAANSSFDPYSSHARCLPPLQALRLSTRAREAETLYRLGQRRTARRIWQEMLREDRVATNVLKNIAICDTAQVDVAATLISWRVYVEALYFQDILRDSPRPHARARADFHRNFSNAYAPAFLTGTLDNKWEERIDFSAARTFLNSSGRVRSFVDHKLLEFLNARFDFKSPPLVLGVGRTEGEATRRAARDNLLTFINDVSPLIPERLRQGFTSLAQRQITQAYEACTSAKRLILDKEVYEKEQEQQLELVTEVCHLKFKLLLIVINNQEFVKHISSLDFLTELARLDTVPLKESGRFLESAAGKLGKHAKDMLEVMSLLSDHLVNALVKFIFTDADDHQDDELRMRQYRRLIDSWIKHPGLARYLDLIDHPQHFYPDYIINAFQSETFDYQCIAILSSWHKRYPELTGPAKLLSGILYQQEKFRECILVLDKTCKLGFHKENLISCHYTRMLARYNLAASTQDQSLLRPVLKDAEHVIEYSKSEKEIEEARKVKEQIRKYI
jgi:hypothetical protein